MCMQVSCTCKCTCVEARGQSGVSSHRMLSVLFFEFFLSLSLWSRTLQYWDYSANVTLELHVGSGNQTQVSILALQTLYLLVELLPKAYFSATFQSSSFCSHLQLWQIPSVVSLTLPSLWANKEWKGRSSLQHQHSVLKRVRYGYTTLVCTAFSNQECL